MATSTQDWIEELKSISVLELSDDYGYQIARTETGFAGMAAAGVELLQTYNFALDLQVRVTGSRIDYGDGTGVGTIANDDVDSVASIADSRRS